MKQTIDESLFIQAFENYNRVDNFGYPGLRALFEYLEDCEHESGGEEIELDVIGLCCEFSQYDTIKEALDEYGLENPEELEENTIVIPYSIYGQDELAYIIQGY